MFSLTTMSSSLNIPETTLLPVSAVLALTVLVLVYHFLQSHSAHLSHVPGPLLAQYTNLWNFYHAYRIAYLNGDKIAWFRGLQNKYGDVIRVGPKSVLVLDTDAVPLIYGVRVRLDKVRKTPR
jgi:hypothetical protein